MKDNHENKNFYNILIVEKKDPSKEITEAFRKVVLKATERGPLSY